MNICISENLWRAALTEEDTCTVIEELLLTVRAKKHKLYFDWDEAVPITELLQSDLFGFYNRRILKKSYERSRTAFHSLEKYVLIVPKSYIEQCKTQENVRAYFQDQKAVKSSPEQTIEFIAIEACQHYLCSPLMIMVEDEESDKLFLSSIYPIVIQSVSNLENAKSFEELIKEQEIEVLHGGGTGVTQRLKNIKYPRRVFCLIDSDKLFENDEGTDDTRKKQREINNICNRKGFVLHILHNRMIENYLPDKAIKEWSKKQSPVIRQNIANHPYFQLTSTQKAFFDCKKGLLLKDFQYPEIQQSYLVQYQQIQQNSEQFDALNKLIQNQATKEDGSILKVKIIQGLNREIYKAFNEIKKTENQITSDSFGTHLQELKDICIAIQRQL